MTHPNIKEFINRVKTDGHIYIYKNKIIKIKHKNELTVDLKYDKENGIFLDDDGIVYFPEVNNENINSQIIRVKSNQVPLFSHRPQFISQKRKNEDNTEIPPKRQESL